MGGSGNLYSYESKYSSEGIFLVSDYTEIDLSASIGYFVIDKLAFGFRPTFTSIKGKVSNRLGSVGVTNAQQYWIGPFGRYYFLNPEKQFNILVDISNQFGITNAGGQGGKLNTFSALAGPVIFINSSLGLEFLVGYKSVRHDLEYYEKWINQGLHFGIGLQIHLEK